MSSLSLRAAGLAATAVLAGVALAPVASASTTTAAASSAPAGSSCVVTSTSPLTLTCTPTSPGKPKPVTIVIVKAPPGVISVGSVLKITLKGLKPGETITFILHGNKSVKIKVAKNGTVTFSYRTKTTGKLVLSVSGKTRSGKGFGKTYHTVVKSRSKGHPVGGPVARPRAIVGSSPAATSTALNAGHSVQVTSSHGFSLTGAANAANTTPIAKGGVSLNAGEDGALALLSLGLLGGAAGLTKIGRTQARRDRRRAATRAWR